MNITAYIKDKIARIDAGDAFTYDDLAIPQGEFTAASKSLSRLVTAGTIKRYRKGVYYKPKQTDFGELRPSDTELLNIYLFEDNKQVAYITGVRLYNQFRLTTQVPNVVRVASSSKQVRGKVGNTMVRPAKSYVTVSKKNIPLLQVLDVAKDFKNIPDGSEGYLTQMRSKIVSRNHLNELGSELNLIKFVQSNIVNENYGDNIHGNLFEALIGAIFLDKGYPYCKKFIFQNVIIPHVDLEKLKNKIISYKSLFIEWCQKNKKEYEYYTFEDNGNESIKHFAVKLSIDKKVIAKARETSKKKAEEKASKRAFFMFQEDILKDKRN